MRGGRRAERGRSQPPREVTVTTLRTLPSQDPEGLMYTDNQVESEQPEGQDGAGWVSFHFADEKGRGSRGCDPHPHLTARCKMRPPTRGLPSWPRALTDHLNKCLGDPVRGPRTSAITRSHPDKSTCPHTTKAQLIT